MASSLPIELVEDILYRIPIGSLVRCKSVCKQWYALLKDNIFIYKHLDLSQKGFIQVDQHNKVQHLNLETQTLSYLRSPSHHICTMIHCDGLLLCQRYPEKTRLAVWNPFLRRVKWIKPSNSNSEFDRLGFGYDSVSRDNYKILRIRGWLDIEGKLEIDIYEFKSKLWRSVDASLDPCAELWYAPSNALSMNGNMYWIARRKKDNSKTIASFDFSRETFKDIGCCVPFDEAVLSGFERDRLSLLHYQSGVKIEVWVTNKVTDGVVSWSKYFNVTRPDIPRLHSSSCEFPTYFIDHKTNNIMVWYGHLLLDADIKCILYTVYKMCDGEIIREQVVPGRRRWSKYGFGFPVRCFEYVPSLVPVPE